MKTAITIALLLGMLILTAGCINTRCTADDALVRVNIEKDSIKECTDACRLHGLDWKTQVYGQDTETEKILCTCYQCRTI